MKKTNVSLAAVTILILGAVLFINKGPKKIEVISHYPDLDGWNRSILSENELAAYLPVSIVSDFYVLSPNEDGLFNISSSTVSTSSVNYVEYKEGATLKVGEGVASTTSTIKSVRTFYAMKGFDQMPIFKIGVENLSPEDYVTYKEYIIFNLKRIEGVIVENGTYKKHEYHLFMRKDLSANNLEGKNTIGGLYIFFPETNTIEFVSFLNTHMSVPNAYLISKKEVAKIAEQIIDSVGK